jgi:hypothetical protein
MDWNSLVNAGMGGKNLQNALKATARSFGDNGAAMDAAIKKGGSFRDSLQYGWLEADVFTKTMKVMSGTQDKWGKTVAYSVKELKGMGPSQALAGFDRLGYRDQDFLATRRRRQGVHRLRLGKRVRRTLR